MRIEKIEIPQPFKEELLSNGYSTTYPPQDQAIEAGVLDGKNVVLASPTASGKTLVAWMATTRHLYEGKGKVVYLVPLRALASEKYSEFKELEAFEKKDGERIKVRISTGDYDTTGRELRDADVIIATNEKMDSILRHSPRWLSQVSLVVADEVHLLHEYNRGPTLEFLLTRILDELPEIQFIALSATIKNAEEFSEWLHGEVITSDWRPVPLKEGVYFDGGIFFDDGSVDEAERLTGNPPVDTALRTIREGGQAIIFTRTRREAVKTAEKASEALARLSTQATLSGSRLQKTEATAIERRLKSSDESTRLSEKLARYVRNGAAFHHAGLPSSHRKLVEDAFREGKIKAISATPTLASGVNLPARTVIITYHKRYSMGYTEPISVFEYKQFCGRAGRPQYDEYGEAIMLASNEREKDLLYKMYVQGEPERITSKLGEGETMDMHLLGLIASREYVSRDEISQVIGETLYAVQQPPKKVLRSVSGAANTLQEGDLVKEVHNVFSPTAFGRRVAQLYISPSTGMEIRDALQREREKRRHPLAHLQMISGTRDMSLFSLYKWERTRVEQLLEEYEDALMRLPPSDQGLFTYSYSDFLQELKTALVLYDWIQEMNEDEIYEKWRVQPGDLYSASYTGEWLTYSASQLALLFDRKTTADELLLLSKRISYGVKDELLPLVDLKGIGRSRGRSLYDSGFRTRSDIRSAPLGRLTSVPGIGRKLAERMKNEATID